ncbi:MAG: hypothetical protein KF831_13200 [Acidobacteria bacterium]|nr:hypothetical protein [Acidobacteriota bacterium]
MKKILTKWKDYDGDIFLKLHSCFYHQLTVEYLCAPNISLLSKFGPDMIITLTDDVYDVHQRLKETHQIFNRAEAGADTSVGEVLELFRILDWRSNETMIARYIASELSGLHEGKAIPHFIFAVKHYLQTLFDLVYRPELPKVYISHPISEIRRLKREGEDSRADQMISSIEELEKFSSGTMVGFLPTTTDELRIDYDLDEKKEQIFKPSLTERWAAKHYAESENRLHIPPIESENDQVKLWRDEGDSSDETKTLLRELADRIGKQITTRDYKLVEQSDCLLVFRPCFNGNPSQGVLNEIEYHAKLVERYRRLSKPCFVYNPIEDQKDLFIRYLESTIDESINTRRLEFDGKFSFDDNQRSRLKGYLDPVNLDRVRGLVREYCRDKGVRSVARFKAMSPDPAALTQDLYVEIVKNANEKWLTTLGMYRNQFTYILQKDGVSVEELINTALDRFASDLNRG